MAKESRRLVLPSLVCLEAWTPLDTFVRAMATARPAATSRTDAAILTGCLDNGANLQQAEFFPSSLRQYLLPAQAAQHNKRREKGAEGERRIWATIRASKRTSEHEG